MSEIELMRAVGVALGTGLAAEVARRVIPGTKYDSTGLRVLWFVSQILTLGVTSFFPGDGRRKK